MVASRAARVRYTVDLQSVVTNNSADNGFRAYNVDPFREYFRNVFKEGGIGIVEMLYRCAGPFTSSAGQTDLLRQT